MKNWKTKLSSRKFLIAVSGIVSGIVLVLGGNATEGMGAIVASVIGYLVAEGYIDGKAVKSALEESEKNPE